jgi:hypothetical protein
MIVIREPISRFVSMFKYWKYGGDYKYKRDAAHTSQFADVTISHFLQMLRSGDKESLYKQFTWRRHFAPQSEWLQPPDYKKSIVIIYDKV